jgi:membrane-bound lytic murein transglycosylase D
MEEHVLKITPPKQRLPLFTALPFVLALTLAACSSVDLASPGAGTAPVTTAAASAPADAASAVLPPYDPLQPDAKVNLDDSAARSDLWHRVRDGFAIPDMDTAEVKVWEQWYASRPDYVARMTARGSKYLYHITEEVERRHMPTELALLPFTESAFNPQAMSVAKASGMWQFVSATGKDFDLKQNIFRDDRRDVLASTRAALDYLQRLHDMFGDWRLALAAYNCGQGNVQRAINRNLKAGLPTDYVSLNLPLETRQYVPKLQAVKNIVLHPENYALTLPPVGNHPYFLSVPIERDIDVDTAARLANVPIDEFRMLNPQLDKPVILAAGTPQVLLPYDNADDFVRAVKAHEGPLATWTVYVVGKTMRPADAAKLVGMSEPELREVNHIPARMLVKSGSTLLVPRSAQHIADVSVAVADSAAMTLAPDLPPTKRVNMRVGKGGETVASVARRWHVSATGVATWNHLSASGKFAAGSTAVLFLPRSTSLARAPTHPTKVVTKAPAARTHVAQTPNARSGTHVATSKAPRKTKTVVAHKANGGATAKQAAKTKVAQP